MEAHNSPGSPMPLHAARYDSGVILSPHDAAASPAARRDRVVSLYWAGYTQADIARLWGISRQRVRQLAPKGDHGGPDIVRIMRACRASDNFATASALSGVAMIGIVEALTAIDVIGAVRRLFRMRQRRAMLSELVVAAKELGRTPSTQDMNARLAGLRSHGAYRAVFGSVRTAQAAAGLPPNRVGRPKR